MFFSSAANYTLKSRQIILLGDSLTQRGFEKTGWATTLGHNYIRKADLVNRGLSGYNTRHIIKGLNSLLPKSTSETILAVVWLGANDAARPDGPQMSRWQHVPVPEFKSNLLEIVTHVKDYGAKNVLLVSPPPVYDKGRRAFQLLRPTPEGETTPLDRSDEFTGLYAAAAAEVAADAGTPLLDLYKMLRMKNSPDDWGQKLFCDGLHFTKKGQNEVATHLTSAIQKNFPEITPEALTPFMPEWDHLQAEEESK